MPLGKSLGSGPRGARRAPRVQERRRLGLVAGLACGLGGCYAPLDAPLPLAPGDQSLLLLWGEPQGPPWSGLLAAAGAPLALTLPDGALRFGLGYADEPPALLLEDGVLQVEPGPCTAPALEPLPPPRVVHAWQGARWVEAELPSLCVAARRWSRCVAPRCRQPGPGFDRCAVCQEPAAPVIAPPAPPGEVEAPRTSTAACPSGWSRIAPAPGCQPPAPPQREPATCPLGQVWPAWGTGCEPLEARDCTADEWPAEADSSHLFVRPGATSGDGSRLRPYADLAQALAAPSPTATVALARGTHRWSGALDRPLVLLGACAGSTRLELSSGLQLDPGARLAIHGTQLAAQGPVQVVGDAALELGAVHLDCAGAGGLRASRGALISLERVRLVGCSQAIIADAARISGRAISVEQSRVGEVQATHPGGEVRLEDAGFSGLDHSVPVAGLDATEGGTLVLTAARLQDQGDIAIRASGAGTWLALDGVRIEAQGRDLPRERPVVGLDVVHQAGARTRGVEQLDQACTAVRVVDRGQLAIDELRIRGPAERNRKADLCPGAVVVGSGGALSLSHGELIEVKRGALQAVQPGSVIRAQDVLIRGVYTATSGDATAVGVHQAARVELLRARIEDAEVRGLQASTPPDLGARSQLTARDLSIRRVTGANELQGPAVELTRAEVLLERLELQAVQARGVVAVAGTLAEIRDLDARAAQVEPPIPGVDAAMFLTSASTISVQRAALGDRRAGLGVALDGGALWLFDLTAAAPAGEPSEVPVYFGSGGAGSRARIERARLERFPRTFSSCGDSALELLDIEGLELHAALVDVGPGCTATVTRARLTAHAGTGLRVGTVAGAPSWARLDSLEVRYDAGPGGGTALVVRSRGRAAASALRLSAPGTGAEVEENGQLELGASLIQNAALGLLLPSGYRVERVSRGVIFDHTAEALRFSP